MAREKFIPLSVRILQRKIFVGFAVCSDLMADSSGISGNTTSGDPSFPINAWITKDLLHWSLTTRLCDLRANSHCISPMYFFRTVTHTFVMLLKITLVRWPLICPSDPLLITYAKVVISRNDKFYLCLSTRWIHGKSLSSFPLFFTHRLTTSSTSPSPYPTLNLDPAFNSEYYLLRWIFLQHC